MGTLDRYVYDYLDGRRRRGDFTEGTYNNQLYRLMGLADVHGARPLERFGKKTIEKWVEVATETQRPTTRRNTMTTVRQFCLWMVAEKHLNKNPFDGVQMPKVPRTKHRNLSPARIADLLPVVPDARGRAIAWLMVGQGLRCVEVSRLDVDDFDAHELTLFVNGKGGHQRELPVAPECARAIQEYLRETKHRTGPLIRSMRGGVLGGRLKPQPIGKLVSGWLSQIGAHQSPYDGVSAHALRHTAATVLYEQTGDLRDVQELLGHASLQTTSIYVGRGNHQALREGLTRVAASYRA